MDASRIQAYGDELFESWRTRIAIDPLTEREPGMTVEDAYLIQEHLIARRLALGDRIVGNKIGLTSRVVQKALGVDTPYFGQLLASMVVTDCVEAASMLEPRAEGEV